MSVHVDPIEPGTHVVQLYEREEGLALAVGSFLGAGIIVGEAAVVVATPEHRARFAAVLNAAGVDVADATERGQLIFCDADATLDLFMVHGSPDPVRFRDAIGGLLGDAGAGRPGIRVYGEMVAILWDVGNAGAVGELEALWNDLGTTHRFSLFCAYRRSSMDAHGLELVCAHHTSLVPEPQFGGDPAVVTRQFEPTALAIGAARRFAGEALRAWGHTSVDDVELVVSELATNAYRYTGQRFAVSLHDQGLTVRVEVADRSVRPPESSGEPSLDGESGRGMPIVHELSRRWGTDVGHGGKTVWAELAAPARR